MAKIVLVEPSASSIHIYSKFKLPRLGCMMLGTTLHQAGYDVAIQVEDIAPLDLDEILAADIVGISTITTTAPASYELADKVREHGIPVVLGGPHVTFTVEEALQHADYVVRGEGDEAILPLVRAIESGGPLGEIPNLSYVRDGKVVHNRQAEFVRDLDSLPIPDHSLLENRYPFGFTDVIVPIMTSRGCPFDCEFCSVTSMFGRRYRFRSTESVMEEIKGLKMRKKHIFFYDDNFTANKKRASELLHRLIDEKLKFNWSTQVRVEIADDPDFLDLMYRSGCRTLYVGFESVNPETLKEYNKKQTVEQIEKAIRAFHRARLMIHGMFVFGGDMDTKESLRETADFAINAGLTSVQFLILVPLPGTRTYEKLDSQGRIVLRDYSLYDGMHVVYEPAKMTAYELQIEMLRAMSKFYSLRQVFKQILHGRILDALIKYYGHKTLKHWTKMNREFVQDLSYGLKYAKDMLEKRTALQKG